jgi:uncharacterized cupredoxin-like copper-binding protein
LGSSSPLVPMAVPTEPNKGGKEGSEAPEEGTTPAPDTAPESGQEEAGETGKDAPAGKTAQTLQLAADTTGLAFDTTDLEAKAGLVRLTMQNPSELPHNVSLEGPGGLKEEGPVVQKDGASEVEAEVKPGEYTFYCSVPGHRESGMEGTLTVK